VLLKQNPTRQSSSISHSKKIFDNYLFISFTDNLIDFVAKTFIDAAGKRRVMNAIYDISTKNLDKQKTKSFTNLLKTSAENIIILNFLLN
jgi:hypothetical protein